MTRATVSSVVPMAVLLVCGAAAAALAVAQSGDRAKLPPVETAPPGWVLTHDDENYFHGPYIAFAGDWSVKYGKVSLRRGIDYADTMLINPATFPAATRIRWTWPAALPRTGVYGYMHIAYGDYAGGVPKQPIKATRVARLRELATDFAVTPGQVSGDYNLLLETFLTSQPGAQKNHVLEVGFLLRLSRQGRRFFDAGQQLGQWTDPAGRVWQVARQKDYAMLTPATGVVTRGTLDFAAALRWLVAKKQLNGSEWFNGLAIGVEPVTGAGTLRIDKWAVRYRP